MEIQQYIEASLHLASDLIILLVVVMYFRIMGFFVASLLLCYSVYSFVFYIGILGVPVASDLFELLLATRENDIGEIVPTITASIVGVFSGLTKVGLAVAILLLSKKLITKVGT